MALTFSLFFLEQSQDCSVANVTDETNFGLDGNAARNTFSVVMKLYKRDVEGNDTEITVDNTSSDTITKWLSVDSSAAGHYRALLIAYQLYAGGTTFALNDFCYNVADSKWYRSLQAGNIGQDPATETAYWVEVTDHLDVLDYSGNNVEYGYVDLFNSCSVEKCIRAELVTGSDKILAGDCDPLEAAAEAVIHTAVLSGAWAEHQAKQNAEAQEIIDYLDENCCS